MRLFSWKWSKDLSKQKRRTRDFNKKKLCSFSDNKITWPEACLFGIFNENEKNFTCFSKKDFKKNFEPKKSYCSNKFHLIFFTLPNKRCLNLVNHCHKPFNFVFFKIATCSRTLFVQRKKSSLTVSLCSNQEDCNYHKILFHIYVKLCSKRIFHWPWTI